MFVLELISIGFLKFIFRIII